MADQELNAADKQFETDTALKAAINEIFNILSGFEKPNRERAVRTIIAFFEINKEDL